MLCEVNVEKNIRKVDSVISSEKEVYKEQLVSHPPFLHSGRMFVNTACTKINAKDMIMHNACEAK